MTGSTGFDELVQRALQDVHAATAEPSGLAARLITNLDTPRTVVPLHRPTRRWAVPLLAAAAAVVVVASGLAVATVARSAGHSPVGNPTPTDSVPVTPSSDAPTASSSPSDTSTSTPTSSVPVKTATALAADAVMNATIDVPPLPANVATRSTCPTGPHKFTNGKDITSPANQNLDGLGIEGSPLIADVTGDGVADAVILLNCSLHELGALQVLLLVGDASGQVQVQAIVVAGSYNSTNPVAGYPNELRSAATGKVVVGWDDSQSGSSQATQDRTYSYTNGAFKQTAGPSSFPVSSASSSPTASSIATSHLSLSLPTVKLTTNPDIPNGFDGTVSVSVHNAGSGPAASYALAVAIPSTTALAVGTPTGGLGSYDCCLPSAATFHTYTLALPTIAAGATLLVSWPVTFEATSQTQLPAGVQVFIGDVSTTVDVVFSH